MTIGKQILQRKGRDDQSVAQWWVTVCGDSRFELLITCARADLFESGISDERLKGAEDMLRFLLTAADTEPKAAAYPNPGLHHRMPPKEPTTEKPKA